jgi:hypothetical protein
MTLAEQIYRALLLLYPADYRHEYGDLMLQIFRDVSRDKYRRQGIGGIVLWWCRTLLDLTLTVIEQRRRTKLTMSKSTFAQLADNLLFIGGAFIALAAFSQFQPGDHSTYHGIYQIFIWLFGLGALLVGLGCIGMGLRYDQSTDVLEQWTLYLSGGSALVMAVGIFAMTIDDSLGSIWLGSGILHGVGLTLFGLLHLRRPSLPIFRGLPLQMASGWLVMLTGVLRINSELFNNTLSFLLFLGMGLAWLAIGLTLHRQKQKALLTAI